MKHFNFLLAIAVMVLSFAGCSKDPDILTTEAISGNYVGTVSKHRYPNTEKRGYVTLTRMSNDVVSLKMSSEGHKLDLSPVNMIVETKNGVVTLSSESGYHISGSLTNDVLSVTFTVENSYTYLFYGKKD